MNKRDREISWVKVEAYQHTWANMRLPTMIMRWSSENSDDRYLILVLN